MSIQSDYQVTLTKLAGEVSQLISSKSNRSRFEEQAEAFIKKFDHWRSKVIEGQKAAKDDPKLCVDKELTDDGWESFKKNTPEGFEIYNRESFYPFYPTGYEVHGNYYGPKLPLNPMDTLRPRVFLGTDYLTEPEGIRERQTTDTEEDLMRYYFLLSVIHAHKGEGVPLLEKDCEASEIVWFMYNNMEDGTDDSSRAKIENLFKTALLYVRADLTNKPAGTDSDSTSSTAIEMTRYDRAIKRLKNNPVICVILIGVAILAGLALIINSCNTINDSLPKLNSSPKQEMDVNPTSDKALSEPIIQQTMTDSPGGTQVAGDLYIDQTENVIDKPIVTVSATAEVRIESDSDINAIAANVKAFLVFVKDEKPLLMTSTIGYTESQTGNDEVVYKAKLNMDAKDFAAGKPASFLKDADYILIVFGMMPSDSYVLGGDAICIINNSISLKFSIPPQKLVNNRILIRNLSESLHALDEPSM